MRDPGSPPMQRSNDQNADSAMRGIAVAVLTGNRERQLSIQRLVESTRVARMVFSHLGFPRSATDQIIRRIQEDRVEVVVVDLHPENLQRARHAIELIRATTHDTTIFALGEISHPMNIVVAMRAGACEYLDRQASNDDWLDAFIRFSASQTKKRSRTIRRDRLRSGTLLKRAIRYLVRKLTAHRKKPPGPPSPPPAVPVHSPADMLRIVQSRCHVWPSDWTLAADCETRDLIRAETDTSESPTEQRSAMGGRLKKEELLCK
jgi:ActR/RegA family two-component response regulator